MEILTIIGIYIVIGCICMLISVLNEVVYEDQLNRSYFKDIPIHTILLAYLAIIPLWPVYVFFIVRDYMVG